MKLGQWGRWIEEFLPAACVCGLVCGLAVGSVRGGPLLEMEWLLGFVTAVESVSFWTLAAFCVAVTAGALMCLSFANSSNWCRLTVVGLATAPWIAIGGAGMNRWLGVRPSQLLSRQALLPNALLVTFALAAVVWVALPQAPRLQLLAFTPKACGIVLLSLLCLLGLRGWLFRSGLEKQRSDVIVILIDALRADHLGSYGSSRDTSPALDRLAADGVQFDSTIAASTFTKSSIASLFTGRYPYQHGVYWGVWEDSAGALRSDLLSPSEVTLAEQFREHGYLTEAWVQNSHLRDFFGFGQGFIEYRDQQGHAKRINRLFRRFLDGAGSRYPFFAYLHYIDLHDPYRPPKQYRQMFGEPGSPYEGIDLESWGKYLAAVRKGEEVPDGARLAGFELLYDAQLRAIDEEIGALLEDLRRRGTYDDTLIVVTSDHGDAFGEHGVISHSTAPYDELIRVPWLMKLPANRFAGRVVTEQVSLVDLYPTLLDAIGVGTDDNVAGCSRWAEVRGGVREDGACQIAISEIAESEGEAPTVGLRTSDWKLLASPEGELLFDLRLDPGELNDLSGTDASSPWLPTFRRLLQQIEVDRAAARDRMVIDNATLEDLRSLGYVK